MNIKFLRQQLNKTQDETAKELQITRTKYARIETGESNPTMETLIKMANYFDVSLDYLCGRVWNNKIGYIPEKRKNTIAAILALSDNDFDKLTYYINGFLDGRNKKQEINFYNPGEEV